MGRITVRQANMLIDEAEERGSCLYLGSGALRTFIQQRARRGSFYSPIPGLFARRSSWEEASPVTRALMVMRGLHEGHPSWIFCGPSAAVVWGLDVPAETLTTIHTDGGSPGSWASGWSITHHRPPVEESMELGGIPVSLLERTILDSLCWTSLGGGLVVADAALRKGLVTRRELAEILKRSAPRKHGIGRARVTASLASGRSAGAQASRMRGLIWELGYVSPVVGSEMKLGNGSDLTVRPEFSWPLGNGRTAFLAIDEKGVLPPSYRGEALARTLDEDGSSKRSAPWVAVRDARLISVPAAGGLNPDHLDDVLALLEVPKDHKPSLELGKEGLPASRSRWRGIASSPARPVSCKFSATAPGGPVDAPVIMGGSLSS